MRIPSISLVVLAVVALPAILCWRDYSWADRAIAKHEKEGWHLAATDGRLIALERPWTWFSQPRSSLWFVRWSNAVEVEPNVILIPQLSVLYDYWSETHDGSIQAVDMNRHMSAYFAPPSGVQVRPFDQLRWHRFEPHMPGYKVQDYVERQWPERRKP